MNHRVYSSFGELESETNSSIDLLFGFTARYYDEQTKLQNNWNRWYIASMGQWMSEDPKGIDAGDVNFRRYVGNHPTYAIDPDGLEESNLMKMIRIKFASHNVKSPPVTYIPGVWGGSIYLNDSYFKDTPMRRLLGIPTIVCHGVAAEGLVGPVNSFRLPGGPGALEYYQNWRDTSADATYMFLPFVAGEIAAPARLTSAAGRGLLPDAGPARHLLGEYRYFRGQGFSPAQARYLTQPYQGAGHHFPIPQRLARNWGIPNTLRDCQFNVLRPSGISRGRFYELHYRVDPYFSNANFPRSIGGSWKGNSLGLERYTGATKFWYATPGPLKAAGGITILGGSGAAGYYTYDQWIEYEELEEK